MAANTMPSAGGRMPAACGTDDLFHLSPSMVQAQSAASIGSLKSMQKIEQEAYSVAQTTLAELSSIHVAVASALDGTIDGEVWVDNPANPQVAVVANGDAYYLGGNPHAEAETFDGLREIIPDWAYLFTEPR